MKKIVMTREIRKWFRLTRKGTSKLKPKYPYCGICSNVKLRRPIVNFIHNGEECYEVHFANNGIGYYHTSCMEGNSPKVQTIKSLDVDKWNGVEGFIKTQVDRKLADKQIIEQIATEFNCSHITAWRKLRAFKTNLP